MLKIYMNVMWSRTSSELNWEDWLWGGGGLHRFDAETIADCSRERKSFHEMIGSQRSWQNLIGLAVNALSRLIELEAGTDKACHGSWCYWCSTEFGLTLLTLLAHRSHCCFACFISISNY